VFELTCDGESWGAQAETAAALCLRWSRADPVT